MPLYYATSNEEIKKIRENGQHGVYFCPGKSNCLTAVPKNIHLEFEWGEWKNPQLSGNGTVGGSSYAARANTNYSGHDAWKAFDYNNGKDDIWEASSRTLNDWIEFYAPFPVKLSYIHFTNRPSYVTGYSVVRLTASNDGVNYVELKQFPYTLGNTAQWDIQVNSDVGYKYFRLSAGDGATLIGDGDAKFGFGEIALFGQAKNTLVLKAGSKIHWPDGRVVTLEQDIVNDNSLSNDNLMLLCYTPVHVEGSSNQLNINYILNSNHYAQTTPPTDGSVYNPETKRIDYYNNGVMTVTDYSLPFCSVRNTNGVISIVDVFDWVVPIKKSLFILPEVKYLSADGLDKELYRSVENETSEISYTECNWNNSQSFGLYIYNDKLWYDFNNYEQTDMPTNNAYSSWYNPTINKLLYNISGDNLVDVSGWTERQKFLALGTFDVDADLGVSKLHLKDVQVANSLLPISEMYYGGQLVYDFQAYSPSQVLGEIANPGDGANNIFYVDVPKPGVYKYWGVGGGNGNTWCYIGCNYAGSAAGFIGKMYFNTKCHLRVTVGRNYEASKLEVAVWGTTTWYTLIQCNYGANASSGGGGSGGSIQVNRDSTFNNYFDIELEAAGHHGAPWGGESGYGASVWNGYGRAGTNGYGKLEYIRKEQ